MAELRRKMRDMRRAFRHVAGVTALIACVLGMRGDAQQAQPPVFRGGINFVRVDVIVNDRTGQPVTDLKQSDFEVTEDNKPQAVSTFKVVTLDGGRVPTADGPPRPIRTDADEEMEAARDDVRLFAIFLDDYHVRRGTSMSVRDPLSKFIETQIGPSDMVGVMYPLQSVLGVRMTRNHDAIIAGIQRFTGRKYDYTARNEIEEQYARYPAETIEQIRNQVSLTAIEGLITHLGTLKEGRKALILVSEGFTNILPPQLRDPIGSAPGFGNPNRGDPLAGNSPDEARMAAFANFDIQNQLREVYAMANRNNVSIYAVDPRGLPVGEFEIDTNIGVETDRQYLNATMDTLRTLAEQTDGRAIVNRNDLAIGMNQIVRDTSGYYLLGYDSTQAPSDGKFHEIKVRVKRANVQVRARKGYWALTTDDIARATAPAKPAAPKALNDALAAIVQPVSGRVIRTWIGASRGENGKTKLTFVWEPVARPPGDPSRLDPPARVAVTAIAPDGSPAYRGKVAMPSRVTFDADPGKLQLRLSVEGGASQVLDSDSREIVVPDLTSATGALGTPALFRGRTLPEYQKLKADPDALPQAAREFSRTDRLFVRVPAYGPGGTAPMLAAHLLNRTGQSMAALTASPSAGGPFEQQFDVPLTGLAPGEYLIEIKTAGAAGDDTTVLVGFRVTS